MNAKNEQKLALITEYCQKGGTTISKLANISSILYNQTTDLNWLGFYIKNADKLELGPFQGLQATPIIEIGNGVCGTAATLQQTINVPNVHDFEGHIVCDIYSKSELVVPIFNQDQTLYGVLDIDAPVFERFSAEDVEFFEEIANFITNNVL